MVAKEDIEKLIEATDMYALVSPYVTLQKSGSGYKGLCPFHNEKTPSFSVSQEKHLAHCFSCGKGGNPIQFLMDIKHLTFMEAVKELANINHFPLAIDDSQSQLEKEQKKYFAMNDLASELFVRNLFSTNEGQKALDYLHERGLDDETIKTFGLGLAPKDSKMLYNLLKQSGYIELDMVDCGLVKNNNDNYTDFFINRIMYPIKDLKNRILGFSGRTYLNNTSQAKYMNTIESPIFKKNLVIYNLNLALDAITKNNRVILHEGYMDVIATYRSGLQEVVCSMGTQLTSGQIAQIGRYTKNVILCLDSDAAGIKASYRAGELFIKQGFNVSVVKLDKTKDSDEYVKKYGLKEYYDYFTKHIESYVDYIYDDITTKLDTTNINQIEQAKKTLFSSLRLYNSNLVREKYLQKFADLLNISLNSLLEDFRQVIPSQETPPVTSNRLQKDQLISPKADTVYEIRLFDYAKISKEQAMKIDNYLEQSNRFIGLNAANQQLWQALMSFYEEYASFDEEKFVLLVKEKNLYEQYFRIIEANEKYKKQLNIPYSDKDLEDCLKRLDVKAAKEKLASIQTSISTQDNLDLQRELTIKKFNMRKNYERK